ncbi:glycoside hydrolase family 97 N-terminal domain-containing protein, partial [Bacteroides thetaiotaomicron]|uniref:glycoside hydrolase family 97 N-terminal domain-containing protein n=1 Tax=Bacteroides thetaiotaomicron TaxID=818 RepID=UPI0039C46E57
MKYSAFFICLLLALKVPAQNIFKITSPDGKIRLQVNYEDQLSYSASFQGKTLISDSPLGFEFKNEKPMGTNLSL